MSEEQNGAPLEGAVLSEGKETGETSEGDVSSEGKETGETLEAIVSSERKETSQTSEADFLSEGKETGETTEDDTGLRENPNSPKTVQDIIHEKGGSNVSSEAEEIDWDEISLNIELQPSESAASEPSEDVEIQPELFQPLVMNRYLRTLKGGRLCCLFCHFNCKTALTLKTHIVDSHGEKRSCCICKTTYSTFFILMEHIFLSHIYLQKSRGIWCCNVVLTISEFLRHRHLMHIPYPPHPPTIFPSKVDCHVCTFCEVGFKSIDNLFLHLHFIHLIDVEYCFKIAFVRGMLDKRVFKCNKCPLTALYTDNLQPPVHNTDKCQYILDHYEPFTNKCKKCPDGDVEYYHSACLRSACKEHKDKLAIVHGTPKRPLHCVNIKCFECNIEDHSFRNIWQHFNICHSDYIEKHFRNITQCKRKMKDKTNSAKNKTV